MGVYFVQKRKRFVSCSVLVDVVAAAALIRQLNNKDGLKGDG